MRAFWGYGLHKVLFKDNGKVLGKPAKERESRVGESGAIQSVSGVL